MNWERDLVEFLCNVFTSDQTMRLILKNFWITLHFSYFLQTFIEKKPEIDFLVMFFFHETCTPSTAFPFY